MDSEKRVGGGVQGYIKDFRRELGSDVWMMPPLYHRVWQFLKYMVNHKDNEIPMRDGTKMMIKKGQHLTSVRGIAQAVGWYEGRKWKEPNPKTVTAILDWLEKQGMIKINRGKGNRQYTLITLINWDLYQSQEFEGNSKYTVDGSVREQSMDINKNEKNEVKNENNDRKKENIYSPAKPDDVSIPFEEIINYLNEKCGTKYKSSTKVTRQHIQARFRERFTLDDFKTVINIKASEWLKDKSMSRYLRPETLFGTKFESYLNQKNNRGESNNGDFDKRDYFSL